MVLVRTCCCGCSLAQGTVGSGVVSMIETALTIVIGTIYLQSFSYDVNSSETSVGKPVLHDVGIYLVVQGSIVIVACVLLFCAVKMKRRVLLLPWLIIRGILLVLAIIVGVLILVAGLSFLLVVCNTLWLALTIYLYIVVVAYYQSVAETFSSQGQVLAPAPTTGFVSTPQQPQYEHKPPSGVASVPQTGLVTYTVPNPTAQQLYAAQTYAYTTV